MGKEEEIAQEYLDPNERLLKQSLPYICASGAVRIQTSAFLSYLKDFLATVPFGSANELLTAQLLLKAGNLGFNFVGHLDEEYHRGCSHGQAWLNAGMRTTANYYVAQKLAAAIGGVPLSVLIVAGQLANYIEPGFRIELDHQIDSFEKKYSISTLSPRDLIGIEELPEYRVIDDNAEADAVLRWLGYVPKGIGLAGTMIRDAGEMVGSGFKSIYRAGTTPIKLRINQSELFSSPHIPFEQDIVRTFQAPFQQEIGQRLPINFSQTRNAIVFDDRPYQQNFSSYFSDRQSVPDGMDLTRTTHQDFYSPDGTSCPVETESLLTKHDPFQTTYYPTTKKENYLDGRLLEKTSSECLERTRLEELLRPAPPPQKSFLGSLSECATFTVEPITDISKYYTVKGPIIVTVLPPEDQNDTSTYWHNEIFRRKKTLNDYRRKFRITSRVSGHYSEKKEDLRGEIKEAGAQFKHYLRFRLISKKLNEIGYSISPKQLSDFIAQCKKTQKNMSTNLFERERATAFLDEINGQQINPEVISHALNGDFVPVLSRQHDYSFLMDHLERSESFDPKNPCVRKYLSELYESKAMEYYSLAEKSTEQADRAYSDMYYDLALENLSQAKARRTENTDYFSGIIKLKKGRDHWYDAKSDFEKVLQKNRDHEGANRALAQLHLQHDEPEQAIPHLERMLKGKPDDAEGYFHLGRAYQAIDNPEVALQALQKSVKLDQTNNEARKAYGDTLFALKDFSSAAKQYDTYLRSHPSNQSVALGCGMAKLHSGQFTKAETCFNKVLSHDSRSIMGLTGLANSFFKQGRHEEAKTLFREATTAIQEYPEPVSLGVAPIDFFDKQIFRETELLCNQEEEKHIQILRCEEHSRELEREREDDLEDEIFESMARSSMDATSLASLRGNVSSFFTTMNSSAYTDEVVFEEEDRSTLLERHLLDSLIGKNSRLYPLEEGLDAQSREELESEKFRNAYLGMMTIR